MIKIRVIQKDKCNKLVFYRNIFIIRYLDYALIVFNASVKNAIRLLKYDKIFYCEDTTLKFYIVHHV